MRWRDLLTMSHAEHKRGMDAAMDATLVLGQRGRLVIPADVRAARGLAPDRPRAALRVRLLR